MPRGALKSNTFSVMAHTGFGPVKITRPGVVIDLPQNAVGKSGLIKSRYARILSDKRLTYQTGGKLADMGAVVVFRRSEVI